MRLVVALIWIMLVVACLVHLVNAMLEDPSLAPGPLVVLVIVVLVGPALRVPLK